MKALSFKIGGKSACFRKPDVNTYAYFTYNNIHRPAIFGILGAIIGLGGYTQLHDKNRGVKPNSLEYNRGYPDFYEKLNSLKISIIPLAPNGYFSKKIQVFNNSVGYASFEAGGNLIVREQWLENPQWQVLVLDDASDVFKDICEYMLHKKAIFIPYLGKNDHPANIYDAKIVRLDQPKSSYVDSLFIKNFDTLDTYHKEEDENPYLFQEVSPFFLQKDWHFYEYKTLVFTNYELENIPEETYELDGKNYTFI
jgi:CRISPR-associated protein Cas5h